MALSNKLGITDSAELAREEERLSKKKALQLFESGLLDTLEAGQFAALKAIHKYTSSRIFTILPERYGMSIWRRVTSVLLR